MFQVDDASAAPSLPAPRVPGTPGFFSNASPRTILTADIMNMMMLELLNVVTAGGLSPSKTTYDQVLTAIRTLIGTQVQGGNDYTKLYVETGGGSSRDQVYYSADFITLYDPAGLRKTLTSITGILVTSNSGVNGIDFGSVAADTLYYIYAIYNADTDTAAMLASVSITAPTMPSGYTFRKRIAAFKTSATASKFILYVKRQNVVTLIAERTDPLYDFPLLATGDQGSLSDPPTWVTVDADAFMPQGVMAVILLASIEGARGIAMSPTPSFGATSDADHPAYNAMFNDNGVRSAYGGIVLPIYFSSSSAFSYASFGSNNLYLSGWIEAE